MSKTIPVKTVYLEMLSRPMVTFAHRKDVLIFQATHISEKYYKELFRRVGDDVGWVDRLLLEDDELAKIIHDENVDLYVLYKDGNPGGFCEFDRRVPDETKIAYFGIIPDLRGIGLGKYFLNWVVRQAWTRNPKRLWLHTCELDHEGALPNYLQAGFEVFDEKIEDQVVL